MSATRSRYCFTALLADALSILRLVLALVILWLGWTQGRAVLPQVILLATAGWISDGIDGGLARRSACPTRLGRFDYPLDVLLTWSEFIYAALAGFISPIFLVAYSVLAIGVSLWFRRKAVLVLFMRGIDGIVLYLALSYAPLYVLPLLLWLLILGIVYRDRVRTGIPRWLHELAVILHLRKVRNDSL